MACFTHEINTKIAYRNLI